MKFVIKWSILLICRELYIVRAFSHNLILHKFHKSILGDVSGQLLKSEEWMIKDKFYWQKPHLPQTGNFIEKTIQIYYCPREAFAAHTHSPQVPFPHSSPAYAGTGAVLDAIRADKAPAPNPISCASKRCRSLGDPMLGDLHSNKEQLTRFTTRHEEKKLHSGASWDFFFVVGWRPIFFLRGRELPVFL